MSAIEGIPPMHDHGETNARKGRRGRVDPFHSFRPGILWLTVCMLIGANAARSEYSWSSWAGSASTAQAACQMQFDSITPIENVSWSYSGVVPFRYDSDGVLDYAYCQYYRTHIRTGEVVLYSYAYSRHGTDPSCDNPQETLDPMQGGCVPLGSDSNNWGHPATGLCRGNPINVATGNKYLETVDANGTNEGQLEFRRIYNSAGGLSRDVGTNWAASFLQQLIISESFVRAIRPDGRVWTFARDGDEWRGLFGVRAQLLSPATNTTERWMLIGDEGLRETYDSKGRLASIVETGGEQTISYGPQGRPARVDNSNGHSLTFAWDEYGRIETITLNEIRSWGYKYDAYGNLLLVTHPGGHTTQYHYENGKFPHALTGITDARGIRVASYAYDVQGRAWLSTHPRDSNRVEVEYSEDGTRTVTDSRHQETHYVVEDRNGQVIARSISGTCGCGM